MKVIQHNMIKIFSYHHSKKNLLLDRICCRITSSILNLAIQALHDLIPGFLNSATLTVASTTESVLETFSLCLPFVPFFFPTMLSFSRDFLNFTNPQSIPEPNFLQVASLIHLPHSDYRDVTMLWAIHMLIIIKLFFVCRATFYVYSIFVC